MKMTRNENEIVVSALSSSKTFANENELASFVAELEATRGGVYDPLEFAAIQRLRSGAAAVVSSAAKPPTQFDEQLDKAEREVEAAEQKWAEAQQAWLARERDLEDQIAGRIRKADGNATEISRVGNWVNAGQAEVAQLKRASKSAENERRRARTRLNGLTLQRDQLRREQAIRIANPDDPNGPPLTLSEFEEREELRQYEN